MISLANRSWIPFPVMGLYGSIDISHQMCMQFLAQYVPYMRPKQNKLKWRRK